MPKKEERPHSILIVSASEKFEALVRKSLKGYVLVDVGKSVTAARRRFLERYYDLVAINMPLPDESGEQFALDVVSQSRACVLLVAPVEIYENVLNHVTDEGVLVLAKPMPKGGVDKAIRFLAAIQNRMHNLEKQVQSVQEKLEEQRLVDRAKLLLMQHSHMTEEEAHRYIGKEAMNHGASRRRIAQQILEDYE